MGWAKDLRCAARVFLNRFELETWERLKALIERRRVLDRLEEVERQVDTVHDKVGPIELELLEMRRELAAVKLALAGAEEVRAA